MALVFGFLLLLLWVESPLVVEDAFLLEAVELFPTTWLRLEEEKEQMKEGNLYCCSKVLLIGRVDEVDLMLREERVSDVWALKLTSRDSIENYEICLCQCLDRLTTVVIMVLMVRGDMNHRSKQSLVQIEV